MDKLKLEIRKDWFTGVFILCIVFLAMGVSYAASSKVSALTEDTTPTADDLLYMVNAPGGTPASRRATISNVFKKQVLDDSAIASDNISAEQASGKVVITNDGKGAGADYNLPSAVAGMVIYVFAEEAQTITLDSATGDIIVLIDGTALDAADAIDSDGNAGSSITLVAHDTTYWYVHSQVGAWVDGGAD